MGFTAWLCHHWLMTTSISHRLTRLTAIMTLVLQGCATPSTDPAAASSATPGHNNISASESLSGDEIATVPQPETERPIPATSLVPLLRAEFALRNLEFERGLDLLLEQALLLDDPTIARRTLQLAQYLENQDAALQAALRLTELDEQDAAAAITSMALLAQSGALIRALHYADTALQRGGRPNIPALIPYYETHPRADQLTFARELQELALQWPGNLDIGLTVALVARLDNDDQRALAELDAALLRHPEDTRALVIWTQTKIEMGHADAFARIESAIDTLSEPQDTQFQYARLLASAERFSEAEQVLTALIESVPDEPEYRLNIAMLQINLDQLDRAELSLRALIDLGAHLDQAHLYLGRVYESLGQFDAAVAEYGQVRPSDSYREAIQRAGNLLLEDGDTYRLDAFFDAQREQFAQQTETLYVIQAEILRDGAPLNAMAIYDQGIAHVPQSLALKYGRAMLAESMGDIEVMESDLRDILRQQPNNAMTLNALGYSLTLHTTRYEEATSLIEAALQLRPGDPAFLDSLGWVYFKMGRAIEAEDYLRNAYTQLPDPEVAAHLGEVLWHRGKSDQAKAVWRDGLRRSPNNPLIREVLQRLSVDLD